MSLKNTCCILFFSLIIFTYKSINAQSKFTLSGHVKDASSGENLPSATVGITELKKGISSNSYGFYSITLPEGDYTIKVSYLGFETRLIPLHFIQNTELTIDLQPKQLTSKEIIISDIRKDENVKSTEMGVHQLSMESIKKLPVIMGEVDVLKSLQLLPGVNSAGEGQSGFYVRGGGPDQNLILLDDAVVYNTGHLFGFFSVFNGDAIKNVTLIKGGMPANYGGRLSSVVDVVMKEGNMKKTQVEGGIGLIASRLSIQGPIKKNRASFMINARRTYIDVLVKPFVKKTSSFRGSGYYFYDLNTKINYIVNKNNRLYLSGYFGKDVFTFKNSERTFNVHVPWGNSTASLRWNHEFSNKIFMNTTAMYNDYNFTFGGESNDFKLKLFSGIKDWNIKSDIDFYSRFNHTFKGGLAYTYHTFTPSTVSGEAAGVEVSPNQSFKKYAHELGAYILDEFDLSKHIQINAGFRYSQFIQTGPYTRYTFDANDKKLDSVTTIKGSVAKAYGGFEPRLNVRFTINESSSVKASVAKTYQYLHLVTNNGSTLPTDLWSPSSYFVRPQKAWQYSVGYFKNLKENKVEASIEVYYKDMRNLLEFREGYTPNSLRDVDYDFTFGCGYAYGTEFFLNKTKGRWTGWLGYTLSWTYRDFPKLNGGERYLAKYDQRHNVSITSTYALNKKWTFSSVFVFGSGNRISLPTELYLIGTQPFQNYDKLNNYALPPYHRLDLGAIYTPKPNSTKKWKSSWAFSIYNVYSRQNPYLVYLDMTGGVTNAQGVKLKVKQVSIFPILPSVTYNFQLN
jgi:hypothetical protein